MSRAAFILIGALIGGVGFAAAGAALGFFSLAHWAAGIGILLLVGLVLPKVFLIGDEER
ncbi:MAG: hypothetical protein ACK5MQ_07725 [Pikeienuella sp.]